ALRFLNESLNAIGPAEKLGRENLHRHAALQHRVVRFVHLAHPAAPDARPKAVMAQDGARAEHRCHADVALKRSVLPGLCSYREISGPANARTRLFAEPLSPACDPSPL